MAGGKKVCLAVPSFLMAVWQAYMHLVRTEKEISLADRQDLARRRDIKQSIFAQGYRRISPPVISRASTSSPLVTVHASPPPVISCAWASPVISRAWASSRAIMSPFMNCQTRAWLHAGANSTRKGMEAYEELDVLEDLAMAKLVKETSMSSVPCNGRR